MCFQTLFSLRNLKFSLDFILHEKPKHQIICNFQSTVALREIKWTLTQPDKENGRFDWVFFLFSIFFLLVRVTVHHTWTSNIAYCFWIMVFSVVWDISSQLTSRCGKSQVEPHSSCLPIPQHVTLNSHEVLEHFKTKTPCYPAGTDGLPTPNLSEKTKEDSNRKGKTEEECTSPNHPPPPHHHRHPLHPSGAVMGACSKCASPFRVASGFVDAA